MNKVNKIIGAGAIIGLLAIYGASMVLAGPQNGQDMDDSGGSSSFSGDAYTLDTCPVSGAKLGSEGTPISLNYEGRDVKFCCGGCVGKFKADADKFIAQIDAAVVKQQMEYYAMDTCPVSESKLGGMGTPIDYVYNNRLVRFCCGGCISKLNADPDKFIAMLDKAVIKAQLASYPLKTDVVTGKKLGSKPVDFVSGNRLVRFASKDSIGEFNKDPQKYFAKLDAAS